MIGPKCAVCGGASVPTTALIRYRRGGKVLAVQTLQWMCPGDCIGPVGEKPHVFADFGTLRRNEQQAQAKWLERFGEPMPPPSRSGRPAPPLEEACTERLQVLLTKTQLQAIDRSRGSLSRSEFVRRSLPRG
jgi:hypothetical protein